MHKLVMFIIWPVVVLAGKCRDLVANKTLYQLSYQLYKLA
jgi:hypothetical protein